MVTIHTLNRFRSSDGATLGLLAAVHALVDGCCAALVFSLLHLYPLGRAEYWQLVIGYNLLAFALQPLCGMLVDRSLTPRAGALTGIFLTLTAVVAYFFNPYVMIIAAGLGNAFFHIGGGVASMTMKDGKAGPPGLFVAPGALGLAAGAALGSAGLPPTLLLVVLLAIAAAGVALCRFPERSVACIKFAAVENRDIIIALLLVSVALRSLIAFSIGGGWQGNRDVLLLFVIAAACGKALGGGIADRIGWLRVGSIALVASSFFFIAGADRGWCAVAGMLLLQSTMPITLAALYRVFPQRPGLTFGLCCLALVFGAAPAFSPFKTIMPGCRVVMPLYILSIVTVVAGLRMVAADSGFFGLTGSRIKNGEAI